jgi:ATP-binding cassette subfamily B protein
MLRGVAGLYEDSLFLEYLHEFLALTPRITPPSHPTPIPCPINTGIVFHDVSFHYPHRSHDVLRGIAINIKPNEVIALVGENGAGKTTLVKLLCRLYDPTSGYITVDGIDLRQFDPMAWRQHISVIFQDYQHYNVTARENIWFGNTQLPIDSEQIVAAAQKSGAHLILDQLPQKYNTVLGKVFQDGEELSIGQWQKIALARAFLRDSQIIVLDEPTSTLDAMAEHEIFTRFRTLIGNRSALLISHRLSTVKMADRIYVLDNHRVVEQGTHDDLLQQHGIYARMFYTQAQHYL